MPVTSSVYYHLYEGTEDHSRPPVVLIHGAGGNYLYWPPQVRRLPGYLVYALDLPGHGKSSGSGQQSICAYADAIVEWMGETGLMSAVFVGHSMGSAIALSLAIEYPEHVAGLVLIGSGARLEINPALIEESANETTYHHAVENLVAMSFASVTPRELTTASAQRMAETRYSVLNADLHACNEFDIHQRLPAIQQPALVLVGQEDRLTPVRSAEFLATNLPKARMEIIPNAGHMVMIEKPQAVTESLLKFLNQVRY